jgi:NADH dehydrogenase [ubiquinone] 1 alpha subcomplex assembly factor 7
MTETMTPLEIDIRRRIAAAGPMPIGHYMALCLADPKHGYYITRDPLGAGGDFTTAPEVSQMFGELIGLWMVTVWQQMGAPDNVLVIELGPGRGTMMTDAMRAAKIAPEFGKAAALHLVEISPALQATQQQRLGDAGMSAAWHKTLAGVPSGPAIVIANEFFDALPINQAVKMTGGWYRRTVGTGADGALAYDVEPQPIPYFEPTLPAAVRAARDGEIFEWRSGADAMELGRRIAREPGAALIIDYGHVESATGETLQAVRDHLFAEPLSAPGEADLTAHVDFEALSRSVASMGADVFGPIEQAEFLDRLGIRARAQTLKANASRAQAHDIDSAMARLTGSGRTGMGSLFKAMAAVHRKVGIPPGFGM